MTERQATSEFSRRTLAFFDLVSLGNEYASSGEIYGVIADLFSKCTSPDHSQEVGRVIQSWAGQYEFDTTGEHFDERFRYADIRQQTTPEQRATIKKADLLLDVTCYLAASRRSLVGESDKVTLLQEASARVHELGWKPTTANDFMQISLEPYLMHYLEIVEGSEIIDDETVESSREQLRKLAAIVKSAHIFDTEELGKYQPYL